MNSIITLITTNPIIAFLGAILTLWSMVTFGVTVFAICRGLFPVWWRLGMGLAERTIGIVAEEDQFIDLRDTLVHSGLFLEKNIIPASKSLDKLERATVILVHWAPFKDKIDEILRYKKYSDALIIYAPPDEGAIPKENYGEIANKQNTTVVNFRGRLLNDICTSMITTPYKRP